METLHTTNTAPNKSHIRLRSILTFVGIVTAIICSLVSLNEIHSTERVEATAPGLMKSAKIVSADLLIKSASTIWSLSDRIN